MARRKSPSEKNNSVVRLEDRGKIVRTYRGSGHTENEGQKISGRFRLIQLANADLYLECYTQEDLVYVDDLFRSGPLETYLHFKGKTNQKQHIDVTLLQQLTGRIEPYDMSSKYRHTYQIDCQQARIASNLQKKPSSIRFSIVNFRYSGEEITFELGDTVLTLGKVENYETLTRLIAATRGVDVTCYATASIEDINSVANFEKILEDVCTLLSLARGNYVTWINYDVMSEDGSVILSYFRNVRTRKFTPLYTINHEYDLMTKNYVETTYSNLAQAVEKWDIGHIILDYVESKQEGYIMEGSGIRLAVCMEMMKRHFSDRNNRKYIIDNEVFKKGIVDIKESLTEALPSIFPKANKKHFDKMLQHIQALNYPSFRSILQQIRKEINVNVSDAELDKFVSIRNLLIHEGEFPEQQPTKDYLFMDDFVGRFLIAALGYRTDVIKTRASKLL